MPSSVGRFVPLSGLSGICPSTVSVLWSTRSLLQHFEKLSHPGMVATVRRGM